MQFPIILKSRRSGVIYTVLLITLLFIFVISSANALKAKKTLHPGEMGVDIIGPDRENVHPLIITSNSTFNLYIMNETEAGKFLAGLNYTPYLEMLNISGAEIPLDTRIIAEKMGLNYTLLELNETSPRLFIFVVNPNPTDIYYIIEYNEDCPVISDLKYFTKMLLMLLTFYLSFYLFGRCREYIREEDINRAKIYRGFGLTFLFGGINYFVDLLNIYYGKVTKLSLFPDIDFRSLIFFPGVDLRTDQMVLLTLLLFSTLFMIYAIETIVGMGRRPYLSYMVVISICLNTVTFFYPYVLFDIAAVWYIVTVVMSIGRVSYIYAKIARMGRGIIRKKAICIILGFSIPMVMGLVGGSLIPVPGYGALSFTISHCISIVALYLIKYGLD